MARPGMENHDGHPRTNRPRTGHRRPFLGANRRPGPSWLQTLREKAQRSAAKLDFPIPIRKNGASPTWRRCGNGHCTPPSRPRAASTVGDIAPFRLGWDGYCLVFVDGRFRQELSTCPAAAVICGRAACANYWMATDGELEKHLARHAHSEGNFFTALEHGRFSGWRVMSRLRPTPLSSNRSNCSYLAASERPGAAAHPRNLDCGTSRQFA